MKRPIAIAIAGLAAALTPAPPAHAGTYDVKACTSEHGNASWAPDVPSGWVTAYTNCPGTGTEGIVTRLTGGGGKAPFMAGARHIFTPPPGTYVRRFQAEVNAHGWSGWQAGLINDSGWLWGGGPFTTWGHHSYVDIWPNSPRILTHVTCANFGGCPRDALYGHVTMKNVVVTVQDDTSPGVAITGGSITAGGWRNGDQDVSYSASDATGIRAVQVLVDDLRLTTSLGNCSEGTPRPCADQGGGFRIAPTSFVGDGRHTVTVRGYDGAWNRTDATRQVLVDQTPPAQPLDVELEGADDWRAQNAFTIRWRNSLDKAAPIVAAHYMLCRSANTAGDTRGCVTGTRRGRGISSVGQLAVPTAGEWRARIWLEDEAGNNDINRSVIVPRLRFDDEPPTLAFADVSHEDPTRVRVTVADATSGVALGQIEARRRGESSWRSLATTINPSEMSAVLDDETLPRGTYELRARAVDRAGNERTTETLHSGEPARRVLPLRVRTRIAVGKPKRVRAEGARGRRFRTILIVRPRARYGRTIPLSGRLTTPGGNPLADADIEVWERVQSPLAEWRRISQLRTSRTGRFRFKALRGPSRYLRFRYPGTPTIRARSKQVELRVRAVTSLRVSRDDVLNGEEVVFRGRLKGRQPGTTGKLVHLQVYTRGRWSTFATPRAGTVSGKWQLPYRFTATRGRVVYRFRALVPREAGYPYDAGVSRSVRIQVRGL